MTPRFQHDCDECRYLGEHGQYDVYWCPQAAVPDLPTVVLRRSDEPSDCTSCPVRVVLSTGDQPFQTALEMAQRAGLV